MREGECKHEMDPAFCADCRGLKEPSPTEGLLIDYFLIARFPGRCAVDPSHAIAAGDDIGKAVEDNEKGAPPFKEVGYVCTDCREKISRGV